MSEIVHTDVCIVGAGPAGATAAIVLGKMKIPHVIVDAAVFPRDKICGDALDLKVVRVLNAIDPGIVKNELSQEEDFVPSMGMRFILPGGKQVDLTCSNPANKPLLNQPLFYTARRTMFDHFLVKKIDKNYSDVRLGCKIDHIRKEGIIWVLTGKTTTGTVEIHCKLLIGADGDHSVVLKHVAQRKINRGHYAAALRQYWQQVDGIDESKLIEIYFPKKFPFAYFWIFPLTNKEANIGFGMASHQVAKTNLNVRQTLDYIIKHDSLIAPRFKHAQPMEQPKGWGIPMSTLHRPAYGDGWMLLGDAASFVSPNNGEGIGPAMLSGFIAAHYIQRALQQQCFTAHMFNGFNAAIHNRLQQEERLYRFANAMPAPLFIKGVDAVLSSSLFRNWYTNKEMPRWLVTAYEKPIEIPF